MKEKYEYKINKMFTRFLETICREIIPFKYYALHVLFMVISLSIEPFFYTLGNNDLNYTEYNLLCLPYSFPLQLFILGICIVLPRIAGRIVSYLVSLIYILYSIVTCYLGICLKSYITTNHLQMIKQTTIPEAIEFLQMYMFQSICFCLIIVGLTIGTTYFYIKMRIGKISLKKRCLIAFIISFPFLLGAVRAIIRERGLQVLTDYPMALQSIKAFILDGRRTL